MPKTVTNYGLGIIGPEGTVLSGPSGTIADGSGWSRPKQTDNGNRPGKIRLFYFVQIPEDFIRRSELRFISLLLFFLSTRKYHATKMDAEKTPHPFW